MPPHFTTLPREIRDAILELCLVVGTIDPYRQTCIILFEMSARKPDISLLAVNKAINTEAAEIFYGKNVWVIKRSFKHDDPQEWGSQASTDEIWHLHRNQIRHVHIFVGPTGLEGYICSLEIGVLLQSPPENNATGALIEKFRTDRKSLMIDACRWKMNICRELGIRSLTIDLPPLSPHFHGEPFLSTEVIWRGCLEPLLDWV